MKYLPRCSDQWICWNQLLGIWIWIVLDFFEISQSSKSWSSEMQEMDINILRTCVVGFGCYHFQPSCESKRYRNRNRLVNQFGMSNQWCPCSWSNHIYHRFQFGPGQRRRMKQWQKVSFLLYFKVLISKLRSYEFKRWFRWMTSMKISCSVMSWRIYQLRMHHMIRSNIW